ncbi:MAG: class I SAM-dependent methyltransferase [Acetobacteraceae bacterium]
MVDPDWLRLNRVNWDERVAVHRAVPEYDLARFRAGPVSLNAIEEAELGPVAGLRVLHLQCHFGHDSLILANRGGEVTGLDFSPAAIAAARENAATLGLDVRFVLSNLYDAPAALPEPGGFDLVFTTWGTICWHPNLAEWAGVIAHFLKPGGRLYFADIHPTALVFDDAVPGQDGRPGWFAPYFERDGLTIDDPRDYADPAARLHNQRTIQFMHPVADILGSLLEAGLRLEWLHEHPRVTWQAFSTLVQDAGGCWRWPDRPWLPLSVSLSMRRVAG